MSRTRRQSERVQTMKEKAKASEGALMYFALSP